MALSCTQELLDDNLKLEPKVVLALSRLARSKKQKRSTGVSCKQIVQYLISNYCNLDGDIESQVMTALLSCVKTGVVCALDNGRYILPEPGSKGMISTCFARSSHGPKCGCLNTMKRMSRSFQKGCCVLKGSGSSVRKGKKLTAKTKSSSGQVKAKSSEKSKTKPRKCAQKAHQMLESRDSCAVRFAEDIDSKCSYCLEIHAIRDTTSQRLCETCHPCATGFVAPYDKFSPREELTKTPRVVIHSTRAERVFRSACHQEPSRVGLCQRQQT